MLNCRAPGKLIISGEHAVVYGRPALAMAVDRYARVRLESAAAGIRFRLPDFGIDRNYAPAELADLRDACLAAYQEFLDGGREIGQVLPDKVEVVPLAFALGAGDMLPDLPPVALRLSIDIPIGCGMGSSAAVSLAVGKAAAQWAERDPDLFELSMVCERCMHGHPSGVDSYVCLHGGTVRYTKGGVPEVRPPLAAEFALVHTGTPACTTGECVMSVRKRFGESRIWAEFETIADAIDTAIAERRDLLPLIRENHRLLCRIGVVPAPVEELVAKIEAAGGAAKVCGAGAVRGAGGGMVMAMGDADVEEISAAAGFRSFHCAPDLAGLA